MGIKISQIAELVDGELSGDGERLIESVAAPADAGPDQVAFAADSRIASELTDTSAGCLIIPKGIDAAFACPTISADDPKLAFAKAGAALHLRKERPAEIHSSAVVPESASIGEDVFIGAFCTIGEGSTIGRGTHLRDGVKIGEGVSVGSMCTIHPGVLIDDGCVIGSGVVIKSGAVIGSKGFGFVRDGASLMKFPQVGRVVIEDSVEIGANTCVDRGALGETRIGEGAKIDNLVQIAHNVTIGKRVVIAALTGISGSVEIGDDCVIGGQVGIADHTVIEDGAVIGAKSAVFPGKRVRPGVWAGIPVQPINDYKRLNAHIKALPRLREEVANLSSLAKKLEKMLRGS